MKRFQLIAVTVVLTVATVAFVSAQELSRREDPPTQTDRMWTKGWPKQYRRVGGFGGINHWDRAAYLADLGYFYGPALILSIGIGLVAPVRSTVLSLRAKRRIRHGLCPLCGYSLCNLPPTAPCPECGKGVA